MIEEQLVSRGITDERLLGAFARVQRHAFLPPDLAESAYADYPVSIGAGQTISQPYIVALMTECLRLSGREKVLEVGTGSGYQTALLAELAGEVYSIERIPSLAEQAKELLATLGYKNIVVKIGDGTLGWPDQAPFDRIIITAASPRIPLPLPDQLAQDGLLVAPLGESMSQILTVFEKRGATAASRQICGCIFVPLIGKYGWRDQS